MQEAHGLDGAIDGDIAIVVSRYNDSITKKLLDGAVRTLKSHGVSESQIHVAWVPGAWELPLAVQTMVSSSDVAGAIALGAVIRGETTHDQHINRAVSQALMQISLEAAKPVAFGLLTVNTLEQAIHRAGGNVGNKGEESALAMLEMLRLLPKL